MTSTLQTDRLILRPYRDSDIPDLLPLIGAPEIASTTLRIPHPYTERDAKDFLASTRESSEVRFAITLRNDGQLCGGVGLRLETQHRHAELGYWIGVPFWRHGYATEASRATLRYGFEQLQLNRIFAHYFKGNDASGRVLKKIGMHHEGCLRQHVLKSGKFIDLELYAILREQWESE